MTKPAITKRVTKGSALTYSELDTNFQNLADATLTVSDGTNSKALNLNDTLQFTAGSNITIGVNSSTGVVTITGTGSGTINSGASGALAYYPSAGTTVDDTSIIYSYNGGSQIATLDSGTDVLQLSGSGMRLDAGGSGSLVQVLGGIFTQDTNSFEVDPGDASIIASTNGGAQSYINSADVDFASFSGLLVINNYTSGNVALWLCGGSSAAKLGDSLSNTSGTLIYNSSINGYRWTNNTGGTITANFFSIKTRGTA